MKCSALFLSALVGAEVVPGYFGDSAQARLSVDKLSKASDQVKGFLKDSWHAEEWLSAFEEATDGLSATVDNVVHKIEDVFTNLREEKSSHLESNVDHYSKSEDFIEAAGHGHHEFPEKTIYDLIKQSNYTKKFASLVDDHPDVIKILNGTKTNHTLFVPVDSAFDHIPDDHDKPSKEFIEKVLLYHVGLGDYPALKVLKSHTIPTALKSKLLGDRPQRLRVSTRLLSVRLNFYSKVLAADVQAKNGIVHGLSNILGPPFKADQSVSFLPSIFSTLLLAYEKTDFEDFIDENEIYGATVFAPTNAAFKKLGLRANAFLFGTKTGGKYLRALLAYHIAPNVTLYSDAVYDNTNDNDAVTDSIQREHYGLKSCLHGADISVDIARWAGFTRILVNGFVHVYVADWIARDSVIHVVDKVLIPPRHSHGQILSDEGELSLDDLKARLEPFLE